MYQIPDTIQNLRLVPVVVLHHSDDAKPLAQSLCDGGLPCAEVTFRTEAAEDSIRIMAEHFPDMLIGAGTVLTAEQADRAVSAGAKFIVSPGFNPSVVDHCIEKNIPIIPGINNPTGIESALSFGLTTVKFFPAESSGGLPMIKALAAPYPQMRFMPTGGISPDNLNSYLSFKKVIACGGSWMVKEELIKAGKFDEIRRLTAEALQTIKTKETHGS